MYAIETRRFWARRFWIQQAEWVRQNLPYGQDLRFREGVPHPREAGFTKSQGADVGQRADFRADIDGTHFHAHEFPDGTIGLHWDKCRPDEICHYTEDFPLIPIIVGAVAAGAVAYGAIRLIDWLLNDAA